MPDSDRCEICEIHKKANQETEITPLSCPNCHKDLVIDGFLYIMETGKAIIADTYDKGPFIKTSLFACLDCDTNFIIEIKPVIWNANHDIFYFNHPKLETKDDGSG